MLKNIIPYIFSIALSATTLHAQSAANNFNFKTDLFIAQFDNIPDADDIHSQAAIGCMLAHSSLRGVNYLGVMGAYGAQYDRAPRNYIDSRSLFSLAFGLEGQGWVDAHLNRDGAVQLISDKVQAVLNSGGKVWVMEAGQADVSSLWLNDVISDGVSAQTVKDKVIVVQHSVWNENNASTGALSTVQNLATYVTIDDGNHDAGTDEDRGPNTPNFKSGTTTADLAYLTNALSASNPNAHAKQLWEEAKTILDDFGWKAGYSPIDEGGLDFSDTVEALWIFDLASDPSVATIADFWDTFVVNTPLSSVRNEADGVIPID